MKQDQDALTIKPGETVSYALDLEIAKPGPFETWATLHVYDTRLSKVELAVRGVAVLGGENDP